MLNILLFKVSTKKWKDYQLNWWVSFKYDSKIMAVILNCQTYLHALTQIVQNCTENFPFFIPPQTK